MGRLAAERLRVARGFKSHWIDIFEVIEDTENLDLMFRPLKQIHGFYVRSESGGGIVINASHPLSLQRYTAAHELGHHILGHDGSIDGGRNIIGARGIRGAESFEASMKFRASFESGDPLEEASAQAFAGSFLMPIGEVNKYLRERGVVATISRLAVEEIYRLAVTFGTSFEAACTQLAALNKIEWSYRAQILGNWSALAAAKEIGYGIAPQNSRAEVLVSSDSSDNVAVYPNSELIVELKENSSTGHAWEVDAISEELELLSNEVVVELLDGKRLGNERTRHVRLRAAKPGVGIVRLGLRPPWLAGAESARTRAVEVLVRELPYEEGCHVSRRTIRQRGVEARALEAA